MWIPGPRFWRTVQERKDDPEFARRIGLVALLLLVIVVIFMALPWVYSLFEWTPHLELDPTPQGHESSPMPAGDPDRG